VFAAFKVSWNVRSHGSSNGVSEEPAASVIVVVRCDVAGLVGRYLPEERHLLLQCGGAG
jgi:hypothetical protein